MKEAKLKNKLLLNRLVLFFLAVFFTFGTVNAQVKTVSGEIKDASGETVIGASVMIKGTSESTISDLNGKYKLNVPANGNILVVTYVGMVKQEIPISGSVINITLVNEEKAFNEVVVIGYGTVKKRDLTGSVSSLSGNILKDIPVTTAAEAITGRMAGVQVTTTEGSPDAQIKIRVRGGGSITQNNDPLYIVDGFPVRSISDIAPGDIQSIDVLKDASSTAIYGSRGANGVIIITTKSAQGGKLTINYNGMYGLKNIRKTLDVLTPYQFATWQYEQAVLKDKVADQYEKYFGVYDDIDIYQSIKGTNWQDETFGRTGSTFNQNVSVNGGNEKTSFNASYSRIDDKAIMVGSGYTRDNLSFKLNARPMKGVKANFTARYSDTKVTGSGANEQNEKSSADSRLKHSVIYTPITLKNLASTTDEEETASDLVPPNVAIRDNYRLKDTKIYDFNGGVSVDLKKNLTAHVDLGLDNRYDTDNRYYGLSTFFVTDQATYRNQPAVIVTSNDYTRFRNSNTLTYDKKNIGGVHSVTLLLGQETSITKSTTLTNQVEAFANHLST